MVPVRASIHEIIVGPKGILLTHLADHTKSLLAVDMPPRAWTLEDVVVVVVVVGIGFRRLYWTRVLSGRHAHVSEPMGFLRTLAHLAEPPAPCF